MEKYQNAMLLSAVGDAVGYRNWEWKHNQSGSKILQELTDLGGLKSLALYPNVWPVSDETIMLIATAEALVKEGKSKKREQLFMEMAKCYSEALGKITTRRPDPSYVEGCSHLHPGQVMGWHVPFNKHGTGFGGATKAMCIGLMYHKPNQEEELIKVATECGRMTHNHPLGFTGSVCTALFTAYLLQSKPITSWGRSMLGALEKMKAYCKKTIRDNDQYRPHWFYFETKWENYLSERNLLNENDDTPRFPANYDVEARDKVYRSWSSEGQPGRRGHDAPMIAYDALLAVNPNDNPEKRWEDICHRAMIHGGENDSTGCIAGFWYGLTYGVEGVPSGNHEKVEYHDELNELGKQLYELSR